MKKFLEEFKTFALKGNVMDMAVGVIIGAAFQAALEKFDSKEDISSMTEFFKYEMEKTWEKTLDKAKLENNTRNSRLHDYLDDKDI